ncbi:hypothetical protein [Streptomyces sp. KAU_LT]|uniref:hypothetical protein n=1 Tax=Streptomyces sp. KAU_LT TaxID=3046669 RepID=UPI0024B6D127|nr:hypothetical protein [Streptomyces sp. KAU_LT]MDI9835343.1 hypothetical protein [Streptomyces sp. KAU_LT]
MARTARVVPRAAGPVAVLLAVLLALLSPPVHAAPHPSPTSPTAGGVPSVDDGHDHVRPAAVRGQGDAPAERPAPPAVPTARSAPHREPSYARTPLRAAAVPRQAHPGHDHHRRAPPSASGI